MAKIVILSRGDIEGYDSYVPNNEKNIKCDIFLCMSNVNPKKLKVKTKLAIVYGDLGFNSYKNIKYEDVITYGMSSKNTVTVSSVLEDGILYAIQRGITTLNGEKIPICELKCQKSELANIDKIALEVLSLIKS